MSKKKGKYLKMSRQEMVIHPLVNWICEILSDKKEKTTTDILNIIRKRYSNSPEFIQEYPANLNRKTLLKYLNTLQVNSIITSRKTVNNVEYWKINPYILNSLECLLPEIDSIRIHRYNIATEWSHTQSGITFYELPVFHMDKEIKKEFNDLVEELKDWRKRFFFINIRILKNWKKKIINNLFEMKLNTLDKQLACLFCHLTNKDHKLRNKWFKNIKYGSAEVVADIELAKVLKKYFYPRETEGQICSKIANHKIAEEAAEIMYAYRNIHRIYPYSIASTILIRIPELMFDSITYQTLLNTYQKEKETFHLDYSKEIEDVKKFMEDHIKGFYGDSIEITSEYKKDAIQLFDEFIKPYYSELEHKITEKI